MEVRIKCEMCGTTLGTGPSKELARRAALEKGHIIEPECRGNLCLCRSCYKIVNPRATN